MEIRIGAMAPKLSEQIPGLDEHFDKDADAIVRLKIRGVLSDAEADRACRRLVKRVEKELAAKGGWA